MSKLLTPAIGRHKVASGRFCVAMPPGRCETLAGISRSYDVSHSTISRFGKARFVMVGPATI